MAATKMPDAHVRPELSDSNLATGNTPVAIRSLSPAILATIISAVEDATDDGANWMIEVARWSCGELLVWRELIAELHERDPLNAWWHIFAAAKIVYSQIPLSLDEPSLQGLALMQFAQDVIDGKIGEHGHDVLRFAHRHARNCDGATDVHSTGEQVREECLTFSATRILHGYLENCGHCPDDDAREDDRNHAMYAMTDLLELIAWATLSTEEAAKHKTHRNVEWNTPPNAQALRLMSLVRTQLASTFMLDAEAAQ